LQLALSQMLDRIDFLFHVAEFPERANKTLSKLQVGRTRFLALSSAIRGLHSYFLVILFDDAFGFFDSYCPGMGRVGTIRSESSCDWQGRPGERCTVQDHSNDAYTPIVKVGIRSTSPLNEFKPHIIHDAATAGLREHLIRAPIVSPRFDHETSPGSRFGRSRRKKFSRIESSIPVFARMHLASKVVSESRKI
jgi:hypothetical protein